MPDTNIEHFDRIVGCILGGAMGDAYGARYEGMQDSFEFDDGSPLSITDDTALTLATCEAIVEKEAVDPESIANRFIAWFREGNVKGIGASTYKSLSELCEGGHWALVGRKGERAAGNGAAMRIAPLAFWLDPSNPLDRRTIRDVCRITHHNDEAYAGALAVLIAIQTVCRNNWDSFGLLEPIGKALPDCLLRERIREISSKDRNSPLSELSRKYGCSGWVVESVPFALAAAERIPTVGFHDLMREIISCGGDTDTNASMAGQITGVCLGMSNLPGSWLEKIPELKNIVAIAENFANAVIRHRRS
jgi:ADP-ribosylglycohydrolase